MNRKLRRIQKKEAKKIGRLQQGSEEVFGIQKAKEFYQLGRITEAVQALENVLMVNPKNVESVSLLAIIRASEGDVDSAIKLFKKATVISPKNAMVHFNLGRALDDAGMTDEAIVSYKRSLKIDPFRVEGHINLGSLLVNIGQFTDACDHLRQVVRIDPENALAYSNLGGVLKNLKQFKEAISCCTQAIAINVSFVCAHYNLACVYLEMGSIADAIHSFQNTLNLEPEHLEAWNGLEIVAKIQGGNSWKECLNDAARCTVFFQLAEYSLLKLRAHEAKDHFKKTMAALPAINDEELCSVGELTVPQNSSQLPKNMIALFHFGRSGTGLFHSLIDGHPEISTLPSIYCRGFFNAGVWKSLAQGGCQGLPERFAKRFAVLFDASSPDETPGKLYENSSSLGLREGMTNVGEDRNEVLSVDRDEFCKAAYSLMENYKNINAGTFFLIVHAAYELALGNNREKNTVFYHMHNPDDFAILNFLRYFPKTRLVMMIREPIQCCESWVRKNFEKNNYKDMVHQIIAMLYSLDQAAFQIQDSVGIRLEDLKNNPERTMQAFCKWLGVRETSSLYEMTAQGLKWWGDPSSPDFSDDEAMSPFGKSSTKRVIGSVFDEGDQFVFGTFFYPIGVRFGYVERDHDTFEEDLKKIQPILDQLLGFEKVIAQRLNVTHETFRSSSSFQLLRKALNCRLKTLNEHNDYPNIMPRLII